MAILEAFLYRNFVLGDEAKALKGKKFLPDPVAEKTKRLSAGRHRPCIRCRREVHRHQQERRAGCEVAGVADQEDQDAIN